VNNATLGVLDDETAGTGSPARFQPTLNTTAANGYVSFELDFYELYTNENVYISNYYMTGVDVDGPEFYEISGYSSYIVDATCVLKITPSTILPNGTRFASGGSELNGITFDNTSAFIAKFPHPSTKINFVIGANTIVSTNRQFSAQFGSMGGVFTTVDTKYNLNPVLSITKTASPSIFSPGNVSQYSVNVSNGGNTIDQVTLTDVLPSEMTYVANSTTAFIPASSTTKTVKDEFTTVAYTNQDGTAGFWTTNWVDNDLNASTGTIFISGGNLNLSNLIIGDQIVRTANLMPTGSTSGGATLTFNYAVGSLGTSAFTVQLSTDGTNYTTVGTLTGTNGTGTFSYTLLPAQISSTTSLKFAISGSAWASATKIATIDNVQISYVYNKADVTRTNAIGGTLTDGLPSGSLVASADAITLEPGISMTVTFNVLVACTASGTKVNTATSSCTGLTTPVSATCSNPVGPVSSGTAFCNAGPVILTASGAAANQVYRWYSASSGGSVLYTGNPYTTPSISVTTTYYVTLYNSGTGCESVRIPVIATYAPLLGTAVINELTTKNGAGGSSYLDDQSSVGFSCTGVTGATSYLWTIPAGATFASPSTGSTIYVNFNSAGQNGAYNVCVTPSNSCNTGTQTCLGINITRSGSDGISGNVYYDADGSVAPLKVNGTGIGSIGGQQLYAVLYDKTNAAVVESQPIASDGTYLFMGLRSAASNYNIYITTNNYGLGTVIGSIVVSLPSGATFNGAIDNDATNSLTGGNGTSGSLLGISATTNPINTNVNFGIALTNPTANSDNATTNEDTSVSFNVTTNDTPYSGRTINVATVDLDPNTPGIQTSYIAPGQGTFTVNNLGVVTFVPTADYFGIVTASYAVNDNTGVTSSAATITVTVNSVNDAPSFTEGANQTVCASSGAQSVTSWATAISAGPANESLQVLSFNITGNTVPGIFSVAPAISPSGVLTYTPSATSGTSTITVTISDDGGTANGGVNTSAAQTFTITVNALPTITLGTSPSVCLGSTSASLPYTATSGSPNQYSIAYDVAAHTAGFVDVALTTLPVTPIPLVVPAGEAAATYNGTITVKNTTTGCSGNTTAFTVTVNALPQGSLTANTVCAGGTGQFTFTSTTGTGPFTLIISGTTYPGIVSGTAFNANPNPVSTTAYTLTSITDANGCVRTSSITGASATITVNPLPTITLGTSPSVCSGSTSASLPYTATSGTPNQFSITYDAAAHTAGFVDVALTTLPTTPIPLVVPAGAAAATYNGTITVKNTTTGCSGNTTAFTVTVRALPQGSLTANMVCAGGTGQFTFTSTTGTGPFTLIINGTTYSGIVSGTAFNANPNPVSTTAYTLTSITDANGCVRTSSITGASATITVNPLPTITLGTSPSVCSGSTSASLPYTATSGTPNQYSITYDAAAHTAGFVDVALTTLPVTPIALVVPAGAAAATYNGTITVKNTTTGCSGSTTAFTVTVNALPIALVLTGSTICASPGGNGTITSGTSVLGINYQLYNSSNATVQASQAGTGSGLTWSGLATGNGYYVIGTNATTSCISPSSNAVNIATNPNPIALVLTGSTICASPGGNGTITSGTSVIGINYQLYNSSNATVQAAKAGTGSGLTWSGLAAGNGYFYVVIQIL